MQDSSWSQAFAELAASIVDGFIRLWKQDFVQVCFAIGMFLALALPLLLVIFILWYVDSSGWRPESGFYKIGILPEGSLPEAQSYAAAVRVLVFDVWSVLQRV